MSATTTTSALAIDDRRAWRVDEFCQAHRVSRSTVYKLMGQNKLETIRVAGRRLIPASAADALLKGGA